MAIIRITAEGAEPRFADHASYMPNTIGPDHAPETPEPCAFGQDNEATPDRRRLVRGMRCAAPNLPAEAPIVVMVHGFMFDPDASHWGSPYRCLYHFDAGQESVSWRGKRASWPLGLGFRLGDGAGETGLCVAFAWKSRPSALRGAALLRGQFPIAYREAAVAGEALKITILALREAFPGRKVDLFAHSLGGRVALRAMQGLAERGDADALGRVILMGAAETAERARRVMAGIRPGRGPLVYNILSRENDFCDLMVEMLAPHNGEDSAALGRTGFSALRPDWVDIQIDHPAVGAWLAVQGTPLGGRARRWCHWSFYARPGMMEFYRQILRDRKAWSIESMRARDLPEALEPRWARLRVSFPTWWSSAEQA